MKLKDLDILSKSDPRCIVYEMVGTNWQERGRTEQINNSLNPEFKTRILLNYFFEREQKLKFVMMDGDDHTDDDVIGTLETTMGKVMGAKA